MSWLLVAIIARFIEGSSALFDKRLLQKSYSNAFGYAFWVGAFEALAIILIPFGFHPFPLAYVVTALAAGVLFFVGVFLYFSALLQGEVSSTNTLLGTLNPIATLLFSAIVIGLGLQGYQITAFIFLVAAGFLLFLSEKKELRLKILLLVLLSAACFGLANTLAKVVFLRTNFISGFVAMKIGGALAALFFLLIPALRKHIFTASPKLQFKNKAGYFLNRAYAGAGSILIYYSISLGTPALVDATAAIRYIFIFLGSWLFLREVFRGRILALKMAALALVFLGVVWVATGDRLRATAPDPNRPITWGVTFSEKFSKLMGLNWKENYGAILNDLGAKRLRLVAYWDLIESQKGVFDFTDIDYEMDLAEKAGAKVILVIGEKEPRWPECHYPAWVTDPTDAGRRQELTPFLREVVNRYKSNPALLYWQVENEPFLNFGECITMDPQTLAQEIGLVKSLDPAHPVLTTDGGEFGYWYQAAGAGDVFGTTMYRRVHSDRFGYIDYHLPPEYFRIKDAFIHLLIREPTKPFIVIELGAEPWLLHQLYETSLTDQLRVFDLTYFKDTIGYAKATGFDDYYLWGAEWWYWMKVKHGDSSFWDYAKTLFHQTP